MNVSSRITINIISIRVFCNEIAAKDESTRPLRKKKKPFRLDFKQTLSLQCTIIYISLFLFRLTDRFNMLSKNIFILKLRRNLNEKINGSLLKKRNI